MVFPFDQDPALGLPEENSGREKIPPHFRRPIECSCKRGILISRHLGAVVISITSQPPHLHCAVTISHLLGLKIQDTDKTVTCLG